MIAAPEARRSTRAGLWEAAPVSLILAAALLLHDPRAAWAQCRATVAEAHLKDVSVSARDETFSLSLQGLPLTLRLTQGAADADLEVLAPLRFKATVPMTRVALRVGKPVDLHGGRIRIGAGAMPDWGAIRGSTMRATIQRMLAVELKQPLAIPCSRLALANGRRYTTPLLVAPPEERTVGTGEDFVPLYRQPRAVDPLQVKYTGRYEVLARRPGWVLLQATWDDGSRIRGWTPERYTTKKAEPLGGWGEGAKGGGFCGRTDGPRLTKMTLRRAARVAASPDGPVWARVTRQVTVDAFDPERSDGWIQVGAIPGLAGKPCSELEHAWVHQVDVLRSPAGLDSRNPSDPDAGGTATGDTGVRGCTRVGRSSTE